MASATKTLVSANVMTTVTAVITAKTLTNVAVLSAKTALAKTALASAQTAFPVNSVKLKTFAAMTTATPTVLVMKTLVLVFVVHATLVNSVKKG